MPDAIGSEIFDNEYQYATQANLDEIVQFYETELSNLGFEFELTVDENVGSATLAFNKEGTTGQIGIAPLTNGIYTVVITLALTAASATPTGCDAAGMIALIRNGFFKKNETVLFWHTGGHPALFADKYANRI